jgi:hypothetical protein
MNKKMKFAFFCSIFMFAVTSLTGSGVEAQEWQRTDIRGDWTGRDFACSRGFAPKDALCNKSTRGFVAVCWNERQTGECGNAVEWCTYKNVSLETPMDGGAPGEIYICK